jgi:hypothetical protein
MDAWGPREEFKAAFLRRTAEAGMTLEETHALVKQAFLGSAALSELLGTGWGRQRRWRQLLLAVPWRLGSQVHSV